MLIVLLLSIHLLMVVALPFEDKAGERGTAGRGASVTRSISVDVFSRNQLPRVFSSVHLFLAELVEFPVGRLFGQAMITHQMG